MVFVAFLALGFPQEPLEAQALVRNELSSVSAYTLRGTGIRDSNGAFSANGRAIRESDGASLSVDIRRIRDGSDPVLNWVGSGPSLASNEPSLAFSGLPIGTDSRRSISNGAIGLDTYDGPIFVDVVVSYRGRPTGGEPDWLRSDPEGDLIRCEGVTRRLLARIRGLKAVNAANLTVAGSPVGSVRGPRGERLVDLVRYCQALNISLNTNAEMGTASFTYGGELVIIPLAAKKIKAGARWIDTIDISLIKDGKWYVSYAALQDARGQ